MKKIIMLLGILLICVGCGSPLAEQYRRQNQATIYDEQTRMEYFEDDYHALLRQRKLNSKHEAPYIEEVNSCVSQAELDQYINQMNWKDFNYYPKSLYKAIAVKKENFKKMKVMETLNITSEKYNEIDQNKKTSLLQKYSKQLQECTTVECLCDVMTLNPDMFTLSDDTQQILVTIMNQKVEELSR